MSKHAIIAAAAMAAVVAGPAAADFPERPISIIVPYSAGGSTDLSMRLLADSWERNADDTTIVIRNQPGGGGAIGTSAAVLARPDGYTLGAAAQGPLALLPHQGGTDYQLEDVAYVGVMGRSLQLLVACADAPFTDYQSFVDYAATTPVQVGNSGAGGANHISAEAFAAAADIQIESIPYPGSADARTACVGGHIDAMVASPAEALDQAEAGNMTPLFVMEDERIDLFPDTPTAVEMGTDFTWSSWKAIVAPAGTPDDVLDTLRAQFQAAVADPQFVEEMTALGEFVVYEDAETFEARAVRDSDVARSVLEQLGMLGMNN